MRAKGYLKFKDGLDYIFAGLLFLLLWPILLFIALWIKKDSSGPIFFRQRRMGIENTEFEIYKFRTMRMDAPKDMPTHLLNEPDAFITKSGRFLRKTSLDELPQLFNILKGEMAFIGPRPALWNQFDLIQKRTQLQVQQLKPGITGWAQVNGRDEIAIEKKAALDGEYLTNVSLYLDMKILFMTVLNVVTRKDIREGSKDAAEPVFLDKKEDFL